jgi:DNA modification methylase
MSKRTSTSQALPPLRLEWRSPAELAENPRNWRTHPDTQLAALADVIAEVGWAGACLYNERTGHLIDGHARRAIAQAQGCTKVPVLIGDWDEVTEAKILATLDPIGAMAQADTAKLEALLGEVHTGSTALQQLLDTLARDCGVDRLLVPGLTDPDDVPLPPDEPTTQPGDLIVLGNHRLLCADSGKPEDVDRLLDGAPIHLTVTDPPYNVKVEPRSNNAIAAGLSSFPADAPRQATRPGKNRNADRLQHHQALDLARHPEKAKPTSRKLRAKDRPLTNDFLSDAEFDQCLHAWFGNIARVLLPGRAFYLFGGYANVANYPPVLKAKGLYFSQAIIWLKEHPTLTRKDYMGDHEWCFYGWREGAAHRFFGPPNATDVWAIKKVNPQRMVHLTEKPVALAARAIEYSSRRGENVLDLFGGSGSSLIAAEVSGRRALLMELDPLYCDVIVARYEQFTGKKALRPAGSRRARRAHHGTSRR